MSERRKILTERRRYTANSSSSEQVLSRQTERRQSAAPGAALQATSDLERVVMIYLSKDESDVMHGQAVLQCTTLLKTKSNRRVRRHDKKDYPLIFASKDESEATRLPTLKRTSKDQGSTDMVGLSFLMHQ